MPSTKGTNKSQGELGWNLANNDKLLLEIDKEKKKKGGIKPRRFSKKRGIHKKETPSLGREEWTNILLIQRGPSARSDRCLLRAERRWFEKRGGSGAIDKAGSKSKTAKRV